MSDCGFVWHSGVSRDYGFVWHSGELAISSAYGTVCSHLLQLSFGLLRPLDNFLARTRVNFPLKLPRNTPDLAETHALTPELRRTRKFTHRLNNFLL
ncbi:hypothetical protein KSP39_PZI011910 [Platanthera zijinensis]|uniref:Uncharacterized protein n=1 Tax=Platanthera zijinensis TaxID=2320716 RepID=A0AAP0BFV4_9ASPA